MHVQGGANSAGPRPINPNGGMVPVMMMVPVSTVPGAAVPGAPQMNAGMGWQSGNFSGCWVQGGPAMPKQGNDANKRYVVNDHSLANAKDGLNPTAKEFVPCAAPRGAAVVNTQSTENQFNQKSAVPNPSNPQHRRLGNKKLELGSSNAVMKSTDTRKVVKQPLAKDQESPAALSGADNSQRTAEANSETHFEQKLVVKESHTDQNMGTSPAKGQSTDQRSALQKWSSDQKAEEQQAAPQKWGSEKKWGSDKKLGADKKEQL